MAHVRSLPRESTGEVARAHTRRRSVPRTHEIPRADRAGERKSDPRQLRFVSGSRSRSRRSSMRKQQQTTNASNREGTFVVASIAENRFESVDKIVNVSFEKSARLSECTFPRSTAARMRVRCIYPHPDRCRSRSRACALVNKTRLSIFPSSPHAAPSDSRVRACDTRLARSFSP